MSDDRTQRGPGSESERARHLDLDAMSLLLDDALPPAERAAAEAHLAACPDCREDYEELRATVRLLHGLPQYAPRRSFTLTPEQARLAVSPPRRLSWPGEGVLRWAALAVAALLLLTTVGQQTFDRSGGPAPSAPIAAPAPPQAAQPDFAASEQGAPEAAAPQAPAPAAADAEETVSTEANHGTESMRKASESVDETRSGGAIPPGGVSGWRIAQLGLTLALLWLIVGIAGLRWMRRLH